MIRISRILRQVQKVANGRQAVLLAFAAALTTLSGFLVTLFSTRFLEPTENAEFLVYLSVLGSMYNLVGGISDETTRSVGSALQQRNRDVNSSRTYPRTVLYGTIIVGVIATSIILLFTLLGGGAVLGGGSSILVLMAIATLMQSGHAATFGYLSATRSWRQVATLNMAVAICRVILVAIVAILIGTLFSFQLAVVLVTFVWVFYALTSAKVRSAYHAEADVPLSKFIRNCAHTTLASVAYTVVVSGFPAILTAATAHSSSPLELATVILAVSITRSPISLAVSTFRPVLLSGFIGTTGRRFKSAVTTILFVVVIGVGLTVVLGFIGPWLFSALYGELYTISPISLALLTLSAVAVTAINVSGMAALAASKQRQFSIGWVAAAIVTVGLTFFPAPLPLSLRAAVALTLGPLVGIFVHLTSVRSADVID